MTQLGKYQRDDRIKHKWLIAALVIFCVGAFVRYGGGQAAATGEVLQSGLGAYCVDGAPQGGSAAKTVSLQDCSQSPSQSWSVVGDKIAHGSACMQVVVTGSIPSVTQAACADEAAQVWLRDKESYFNPDSDMCLTALGPNEPISMSSCARTPSPDQIWSPAFLSEQAAAQLTTRCSGTLRQRVACYAEKEWTAWQSGPLNHEALLTLYTDGAPSEAWCADFVSYVYKEAGRPFSGAYGGWDEGDANAVQNYGFTLHPAGQGYVPQPGDVAYFDYSGGHVEIVVSGGQHPTFIYGNSGAIDPSTGNGEMKANSLTSDGTEGKLVYYLSPTH